MRAALRLGQRVVEVRGLDQAVAARRVGAATLCTYADCNMNAQKTALLLGIHPNTVYSRMQKFERITGLNALQFHALGELLLALDWAQRE